MDTTQFGYWPHTRFIRDAEAGRGDGFSLEAPESMRFFTRSKLLSAEEAVLAK